MLTQRIYKKLPNYFRGFAREAFYYAAYLVKPKKEPQHKFIVFGLPRSGSTLLVTLLDSLPQVQCEGEIFLHRVLFPRRYLDCRSKLAAQDAYGFKLLAQHFDYQKIADPGQFVLGLHQQGYHIISIKRRNLLRATLSLLYAIHRRNYHHHKVDGELELPKMTVQIPDLRAKLSWMETLATRHGNITSTIPHLALVYEDHLLDPSQHQTTSDLVSGYIGVPPEKASSDLVKIGPPDISQFIANTGEIQEYLHNTKYAAFLPK